MRAVLLSVLLVACGSPKTKGPAWPEPSKTADDGGESLAPRETSVAAAVEKSESDDDADDKPAEPAAKPAATAEPAEKPATTPTISQPQPIVDDVIITEDIIIDIDE